MKIENGKLVDYNLFDIKNILRDVVKKWKEGKLPYIIEELKEFVAHL